VKRDGAVGAMCICECRCREGWWREVMVVVVVGIGDCMYARTRGLVWHFALAMESLVERNVEVCLLSITGLLTLL
jgi:hypothetical protein